MIEFLKSYLCNIHSAVLMKCIDYMFPIFSKKKPVKRRVVSSHTPVSLVRNLASPFLQPWT